ncbi:hypothetical protein HK405_007170, partial [Cladochytrium tenue]
MEHSEPAALPAPPNPSSQTPLQPSLLLVRAIAAPEDGHGHGSPSPFQQLLLPSPPPLPATLELARAFQPAAHAATVAADVPPASDCRARKLPPPSHGHHRRSRLFLTPASAVKHAVFHSTADIRRTAAHHAPHRPPPLPLRRRDRRCRFGHTTTASGYGPDNDEDDHSTRGFQLPGPGLHLYTCEASLLPLLRAGATWSDLPAAYMPPAVGILPLQQLGGLPTGGDVSPLFANTRLPLPQPLFFAPTAVACAATPTGPDGLPLLRVNPLRRRFDDDLADALSIRQPPIHGALLAARSPGLPAWHRRPDIPAPLRRLIQRPTRLASAPLTSVTADFAARNAAPAPAPSRASLSSARLRPPDDLPLAAETGWTLVVRGGALDERMPACVHFRGRMGRWWPSARYIIGKVEEFLRTYGGGFLLLPSLQPTFPIPDCHPAVEFLPPLAAVQPLPPPAGLMPYPVIRMLLADAAAVLALATQPGRRLRAVRALDERRRLAATTLQRWWRAARERARFVRHLRLKGAGRVLLRAWRMRLLRRANERAARRRFEEVHLRRFRRLMAAAIRDWAIVAASGKRTVVMLAPRFGSVRFPQLLLGRTIVLAEENADCILVSPTFEPDDVEFFSRAFDCSFPQNSPLENGRFRIIRPEASHLFVPGSRLAAMLLASPKALAELREALRGKAAVLCCDAVGEPEIILSSPTLAASVMAAAKDDSASGHAGGPPSSSLPGQNRRRFSVAWTSGLSPGLWRAADALRRLAANEIIPRGMDKDEFVLRWNQAARGDAREVGGRDTGRRGQPHQPRGQQSDNCVKRPSKSAPGGVIEAMPVADGRLARQVDVGIIVDPRGTWTLVSTVEVHFGERFQRLGLVVPQLVLEHTLLVEAVAKLASFCAAKGVVGFVTLQLVVWRTEKRTTRFWCTNLYPFLSPFALHAASVTISTGCRLDRDLGFASFAWDAVPLVTVKAEAAKHLDRPRMRRSFEAAVAKEAGRSGSNRRVAIVLLGLCHSE